MRIYIKEAGDYAFTPRQIQVLGFVIEGYTNKHIAHELGIAEVSVKTHVTALLKGFRVSNRTRLAIVMLKRLEKENGAAHQTQNVTRIVSETKIGP